MANPNPVLIKAYLKSLLKSLDEKKSASAKADGWLSVQAPARKSSEEKE